MCHKISINNLRRLTSMKTQFLTQILKKDKDLIYVTSYDELLSNVEILKCTHKRIKDRLRAYYQKIWKDMLVKINMSLVYRRHKTEFKMESYLTQVTNTSHGRALAKLRLSDHKLEIESGRYISHKIN